MIEIVFKKASKLAVFLRYIRHIFCLFDKTIKNDISDFLLQFFQRYINTNNFYNRKVSTNFSITLLINSVTTTEEIIKEYSLRCKSKVKKFLKLRNSVNFYRLKIKDSHGWKFQIAKCIHTLEIKLLIKVRSHYLFADI